MRFPVAVLFAAALCPLSALAQNADPTYKANAAIKFPPPPTHYTSTTTALGFLLEDPVARAILDKVLPGVTSDPKVEKARGLSLKTLQAYSNGKITDEMLAQADAEFSKIPMKQ